MARRNSSGHDSCAHRKSGLNGWDAASYMRLAQHCTGGGSWTMSYNPIGDYGIIGNMVSAAMVGEEAVRKPRVKEAKV